MDLPMEEQSLKTPPHTPPRMLDITVKFVMAGKPEITVRVPQSCTVRGLKAIIAESSEIFPDKQLLLYNDNEMRDDDAPISHYGITTNCTVTMAVNMNTGVTKQGSSSGNVTNVIFYVPANFPQDNNGLRSTIKSITTVKGKKMKRHKRVEKMEDVQLWTPEKQLEIELTRNRMKALMRKKNKTKLLSPCITPVDGGSVISSAVHSPTGSRTPSNESANSTPRTSRESDHKTAEDEVAEKEMKLFFEPMETMDQLKQFHRQKSMIQPPQSHQELDALKKKLSTAEKTSCKMCGRKVPPAEQTILCRCKSLFCRKHRDPKTHQCKIDYKQTGRKKINQMMPKIGEGGARKGK